MESGHLGLRGLAMRGDLLVRPLAILFCFGRRMSQRLFDLHPRSVVSIVRLLFLIFIHLLLSGELLLQLLQTLFVR